MELVSEMFPVVIDPASYGFSPSQLLGLSTPPASQRATPAASFNEFSASLQQSTGGKWLFGGFVGVYVPSWILSQFTAVQQR